MLWTVRARFVNLAAGARLTMAGQTIALGQGAKVGPPGQFSTPDLEQALRLVRSHCLAPADQEARDLWTASRPDLPAEPPGLDLRSGVSHAPAFIRDGGREVPLAAIEAAHVAARSASPEAVSPELTSPEGAGAAGTAGSQNEGGGEGAQAVAGTDRAAFARAAAARAAAGRGGGDGAKPDGGGRRPAPRRAVLGGGAK